MDSRGPELQILRDNTDVSRRTLSRELNQRRGRCRNFSWQNQLTVLLQQQSEPVFGVKLIRWTEKMDWVS